MTEAAVQLVVETVTEGVVEVAVEGVEVAADSPLTCIP